MSMGEQHAPAGHSARPTARDREIIGWYRAGTPLRLIGDVYGLTESGVWRVLQRLGALGRSPAPRSRRPGALRPGPKPVWPDCPDHLLRDYRKVRAVIGSRAARDQLMRAQSQTGQSGRKP